jgi:hypothetical protein
MMDETMDVFRKFHIHWYTLSIWNTQVDQNRTVQNLKTNSKSFKNGYVAAVYDVNMDPFLSILF